MGKLPPSHRKVLLPAIAGTSVMTLFSYLISALEKKNFSEPQLLAAIEKQFIPPALRKLSLPAGWLSHYSIGVLMTLAFDCMWHILNIKAPAKKGLTAGISGGLIAVISWKLLFTKLPCRSHNYYKQFYLQLYVAHFIFALVIAATQFATDKYAPE